MSPQALRPSDGGQIDDPQTRVSPPELVVTAQATPPTPLVTPYSQPYNTVAKLLVRFNVNGSDHFYFCSAALAGSFQLLTAGHCIFNWDLGGVWASEVWAWPAHTDAVEPFGVPDHPYAEAKAVYLRSYAGWTVSQNFDHDWGMITLDRRIGDHTGWLGREANVQTTSLNFSGYPAEPPYVPVTNPFQYPGFDFGNVVSYSSGQITLNAYTYGGHSGGPAWRYDSGSGGHWIQGINSRSDRAGTAWETLLTSTKLTDLASYISTDESTRPPAALPELVEYVFNGSSKGLLTSATPQGGSFQVRYNVLNAGYSNSGQITIAFHLSTSSTISAADPLAGSITLSSLDAFQYLVSTATLTVPATLPPGFYYVGWIVTGAVPDYVTTACNDTGVGCNDIGFCNGTPCDDIAVITSTTLQVTPACFSLSLSHTGAGSDPVATLSSTGCPSGQYGGGEHVQLSASPSGGWQVGSWTGTDNDASTATSNTLTMPSAGHTASVNYTMASQQCFHLTVSHTGSGSDPAAYPASSSGCSGGQYHAGELIQLTAGPSSGWQVGSWSGTNNDASTAITNMVTMPASDRMAAVQYQRQVVAGASFYTLTPCRLLDTRNNGSAIMAGTGRLVAVAGSCGIPLSAVAVSINLTVAGATSSGFLSVVHSVSAPPSTSTINFQQGQVRANNAVVTLNPDGTVAVVSGMPSGQVDFIIDVSGYFQ